MVKSVVEMLCRKLSRTVDRHAQNRLNDAVRRVLEPLAKLVAEPLVLLAGGEDDQVVDVSA